MTLPDKMFNPNERDTTAKPRLSYSRISLFQRCPKAHWWCYDQGLVSKEKTQALVTGDLFHKLHEQYAKGTLSMEKLANLDDYVRELYPNATDTDLLDESAYESARLFSGYVERWQDDPLESVSTEMHIELEMPEFFLYTRIDWVARTPDGRLWPVEIKTTARMDSFYINGLKGGLQEELRRILVDTVLPEPTAGTIFDIAVKTKIPQFVRNPVMGKRQRRDWAWSTINGVWQRMKRGECYQNCDACFMYNRNCDYLRLCENDTPMVREAYYEPKKDGAKAS